MNSTTNINGAAPVGGAVAAILVWLINVALPSVPIPDVVAVAIGTICIYLAGLLIDGRAGATRRRRRDLPD